jgi:hypothetical protein
VLFCSISGVFLVDMSLAQALRVVHRRVARRREERCDERPRDPHLHHAIFPQVRFENDDVGQ